MKMTKMESTKSDNVWHTGFHEGMRDAHLGKETPEWNTWSPVMGKDSSYGLGYRAGFEHFLWRECLERSIEP